MARSLIEERYTWPVRTVLLGGGGLRGHLLPDLTNRLRGNGINDLQFHQPVPERP
jgi:hypothetical protein